MKKTVLAALAMVAAVSLGGCQTQNDRATNGALIGGATGATIGAVTTGKLGGAVAGGIIGAAGGAIIGAATAPGPGARCARHGYDYYGNRVCTQYYAN